MTIWPLSQGEIAGVREDLLSALREDPAEAVASHPRSQTMRAEYIDRVCAGGFPLALRRTPGPARNRWFDDYIRQSIERDVLELARVRERQQLGEVLERLAGRTGQVLNLAATRARTTPPRPHCWDASTGRSATSSGRWSPSSPEATTGNALLTAGQRDAAVKAAGALIMEVG